MYHTAKLTTINIRIFVLSHASSKTIIYSNNIQLDIFYTVQRIAHGMAYPNTKYHLFAWHIRSQLNLHMAHHLTPASSVKGTAYLVNGREYYFILFFIFFYFQHIYTGWNIQPVAVLPCCPYYRLYIYPKTVTIMLLAMQEINPRI